MAAAMRRGLRAEGVVADIRRPVSMALGMVAAASST
jgi:hypothetical protein